MPATRHCKSMKNFSITDSTHEVLNLFRAGTKTLSCRKKIGTPKVKKGNPQLGSRPGCGFPLMIVGFLMFLFAIL